MIHLPVSEAFAFDYLAILWVKTTKGLQVEPEYKKVFSSLSVQVGERFHEIIESNEYQEMLEANLKTFEYVERAKNDLCPASEVDKANCLRISAKNALQSRFWDTPDVEKKTNRPYNVKDTLFLRWHLGLGDAIICNGLVRALAKKHEHIVLPAKLEKVLSTFWMFSDLQNVTILPIEGDSDMNEAARGYTMLGLGLWSKRGLVDWKNWDRQFYEDAGVPFDERWTGFHVPECQVIEPPIIPYAFIHQEVKRGMAIHQMPTMTIYEPPKPPHIFWNLEAIRRATEIHVVNSCFLSLVESVPTTANRLVLHNYARTDCGPPTLRKSWEVLS